MHLIIQKIFSIDNWFELNILEHVLISIVWILNLLFIKKKYVFFYEESYDTLISLSDFYKTHVCVSCQ